MADEQNGNRPVPHPLPGLSAYEINEVAIPPILVGLGIGLLSILMRFGVVAFNPSYFWPMFIIGWTGILLGAIIVGFRRLKEKKERAAGYVTIAGFPDRIRLDRRTGAVLRMPGEPEPTGPQIKAIRRRARVDMREAKR
jgi:hypothetical protein